MLRKEPGASVTPEARRSHEGMSQEVRVSGRVWTEARAGWISPGPRQLWVLEWLPVPGVAWSTCPSFQPAGHHWAFGTMGAHCRELCSQEAWSQSWPCLLQEPVTLPGWASSVLNSVYCPFR